MHPDSFITYSTTPPRTTFKHREGQYLDRIERDSERHVAHTQKTHLQLHSNAAQLHTKLAATEVNIAQITWDSDTMWLLAINTTNTAMAHGAEEHV